jgi:hypothetical protein
LYYVEKVVIVEIVEIVEYVQLTLFSSFYLGHCEIVDHNVDSKIRWKSERLKIEITDIPINLRLGATQ